MPLPPHLAIRYGEESKSIFGLRSVCMKPLTIQEYMAKQSGKALIINHIQLGPFISYNLLLEWDYYGILQTINKWAYEYL